MSALTFSLLTDDVALQNIKDEWIALTDAAASPMYVTYHYCANTWYLIQKPLGRELCCLTGRIDNKLVFLWPLVKYRQYRLWSVLRSLAPHAAEFSDVAICSTIDKAATIQKAWRFIIQRTDSDVLNLPFVINNTVLHNCFHSFKGIGADNDMVPYLQTQGETWQTYTASLGGDHRRSLARRRKVLMNGIGNVEYVTPELDDDISNYLGWLISTKKAWVTDKGKVDASLDTDDFKTFLIKLATSDETRDSFKVFALLLDGKPVSVKLVAVRNRHVNRIIAAYDMRHSKASPGMLLDEFIIKWVVDHQYSCNFGVGGEASKLVWSRNQICLATSYQIPITSWGRVAYNLWRYRNKIAGHKPVTFPKHVSFVC